ncbi:macro domain-containing protein [Myxococcus sp. 1LA]
MPTLFVSGDLLRQTGLHALAHGCNCAGAMGKGIAVEFRARFPEMYEEYKKRCTAGRFNLGDVFTWTEADVTVFNLGTQKTWRTKADLQAIERALSSMVEQGEGLGIGRIGLPRIGAGLGGLPWEPIRDLLLRIGEATRVTLIVFEEYVPGEVVELPQ